VNDNETQPVVEVELPRRRTAGTEAELEALARRRADAERNLNEAIRQLRAAVLRALADGQSEAAVSRDARVDRMTVRRWAGK
jgi:uncharacterized MAPEG superfamily protein